MNFDGSLVITRKHFLCLYSDGELICYKLNDDEHDKDYQKGRYKERDKINYVGNERHDYIGIAELQLYPDCRRMVHKVMENGKMPAKGWCGHIHFDATDSSIVARRCFRC